MKITDDVFLLESAGRSHAFLVLADENALIDTGLPGHAGHILKELSSLGVEPSRIKDILLTHHDIDHIGNAKQLQDATGASLWSSAEDLPYIAGSKNRPGMKHLFQILSHPPKPAVTGTFSPGQTFGEIKPIPAPGHTPGHTVFAFRNVLFTGDLFMVRDGKPEMMSEWVHWNMAEVKKSISMIRDLDVEWYCPSHGRPLRNSPDVRKWIESIK